MLKTFRLAFVVVGLAVSAAATPLTFTFADGATATGSLTVDSLLIAAHPSPSSASVPLGSLAAFSFSAAGHTWDLSDTIPASWVNFNATISPTVLLGFGGLVANNGTAKLHLAGSAGFEGLQAIQYTIYQYQGAGSDPQPTVIGAYDGILVQRWGHWSPAPASAAVGDAGITVALLVPALAGALFVRQFTARRLSAN